MGFEEPIVHFREWVVRDDSFFGHPQIPIVCCKLVAYGGGHPLAAPESAVCRRRTRTVHTPVSSAPLFRPRPLPPYSSRGPVSAERLVREEALGRQRLIATKPLFFEEIGGNLSIGRAGDTEHYLSSVFFLPNYDRTFSNAPQISSAVAYGLNFSEGGGP